MPAAAGLDAKHRHPSPAMRPSSSPRTSLSLIRALLQTAQRPIPEQTGKCTHDALLFSSLSYAETGITIMA